MTAPPSLVAENLGSQSNLVTAADEGTQNPLILVNLAFTGGVAPTATAISTSQYTVNPTASTTPVTINTTSGYWWGAGEEGTGGASPVPNPTVLVDGTPIGSIGAGGASTLTVSAGCLRAWCSWYSDLPGDERWRDDSFGTALLACTA